MVRTLFIIVISCCLLLCYFYFQFGIKCHYFYSPDKAKVITIVEPNDYIISSKMYIVPYKYEGVLRPRKNCVIINPTCSDAGLTVNWQPDQKFKLKIYYSCPKAFIANYLDSEFYYAKDDPDGYLDDGDKYVYPKYSSSSFYDIIK